MYLKNTIATTVLVLLVRTIIAWTPGLSTPPRPRRTAVTRPDAPLSITTSRPLHQTPWTTALFAIHNNEDEDDEDEDDDDDIPDVDVSKFKPSSMSYGLNTGRSSPSQRKAMGRSATSTASIHICSNCASEFVKWMGRCPTCKEWNTLQEQVVARQSFDDFSMGGGRFGTSSASTNANFRSTSSWLDGTPGVFNSPTRLTDVIERKNDSSKERLEIPNDQELNNVLGGGIMSASLTLMGGEPGVGKSTLLLQMAASLAAECAPLPGIGMGPMPDQARDGPGPVWYISGEETQDQVWNALNDW